MSSDSINVARLKKGSDVFEVVVDPDKAVLARQNPELASDALSFPKVFSDAKKGLQASDEKLQKLFKTTDPVEVAKVIIKQGDIQVTSEYRQKMVEQKKKQLINRIHRYGVDPRTNAPHPVSRIEAALEQAKFRIDELKSVDVQVKDALKKLQPIIPIKFVTKDIELVIPAQHAAKAYSAVKMLGKVKKESWNPDGSWSGVIEVPGGIEQEVYDRLNSITHGEVQAKVVSIR